MPQTNTPNVSPGTRQLADRMGLDPDSGQLTVTRRGAARHVNLGLGNRYGAIARDVGGLNARARFAWLLTFAQLPAEQLDEGASEEIANQLLVFALLQGVRGTPIHRAQVELNISIIRQLRRDLEVGLRPLTRDGGDWPLSLTGIKRRFVRQPDRSITIEFFAENFIDSLMWSVGDLLRDHGARLMACARAQCDRLFLRRKRSTYCSNRCSQKVRTDRVRAKLTPAGRATRNRKRRDYYLKQQQQQLGPAVKVHPRRAS